MCVCVAPSYSAVFVLLVGAWDPPNHGRWRMQLVASRNSDCGDVHNVMKYLSVLA